MSYIDTNWIPPHRLILKQRSCEWNSMQVLKTWKKPVDCQILSVVSKVKSAVFSDTFDYGKRAKETGIVWSRLQSCTIFFVMTINKAQGQSLNVWYLLGTPAGLAHGQLYTAQSRATTQAGLTILNAPLERSDGTVVYDHLLNIVYRPVLDKEPVSSLAATSHAEKVTHNDDQPNDGQFWENRRLNEWQRYGIYRYADKLPMTVAHFLYSGLADKLDAQFIVPPQSYVADDRVHFVKWRMTNGLPLTREDCLVIKQDPDNYIHEEEAVGDAEDNHEGDRPEQEKEVNNNDKTQEVDLSQLRKGCSSEAHTAKLDDFKDNSQSKKNKVAVTAKSVLQ
uniref:Uncharacterized protein n=1 Tax=Ditylenchus dipsaci TaxID=166011 RepID=A0A915DY48_9BILA